MGNKIPAKCSGILILSPVGAATMLPASILKFTPA